MAALAQVQVPLSEDIQTMVASLVAAAMAPTLAKIELVESAEQKPATKPRSILKKKTPPVIGSTTALKALVRVSTSAKKAAFLKVKAAAMSMSPTKWEAVQAADIHEDKRIPKKQKVVIDNESEEEEDE